MQGACEQIHTQCGRIKVLINNARISLPTKYWENLHNWHKLIEVNLWGVLIGIHIRHHWAKSVLNGPQAIY
ncbi:MAG TPA: hypothetical protein DCZ03_04800 [Gammaproteobacteria bacterium]|nr:hypothetical protein [Gammaproteobacteria bacterium]